MTEITVSYYDLEEAFIYLMKKKHNWEIDGGSIESGRLTNIHTTYAFKEEGTVDKDKTTVTQEHLDLDHYSEITFYIEDDDDEDT
jgi:hypothetical protein|tara:strand:- start:206 stop:460 length:255 start_codon:yes stop_codon:yes gene_type:complete